MTIQQILFLYFAVMIVSLSLGAVLKRNPVHSVIMVLAMFFHMAGVYLMLNAEFLAAVQVIVYAGAVLVLYLFVVFLVNLKKEVRTACFIKHPAYAAGIAGLLFLVLFRAAQTLQLGPTGEWSVSAIEEATFTKALALELFTRYMLPFEITGLILLVAVIGGIVLAKRDNPQEIEAGRSADRAPAEREA
jgi:NADH-quinone oxidoreductase subunit J